MKTALNSFDKYDSNDNFVGTTRYEREAFYSGEEDALVAKIAKVSAKGTNLKLQAFYKETGIPEGVGVFVNGTGSTTEVPV